MVQVQAQMNSREQDIILFVCRHRTLCSQTTWVDAIHKGGASPLALNLPPVKSLAQLWLACPEGVYKISFASW